MAFRLTIQKEESCEKIELKPTCVLNVETICYCRGNETKSTVSELEKLSRIITRSVAEALR